MLSQIFPGATYMVVLPAPENPHDEQAAASVERWVGLIETFGAEVKSVDFISGVTSVQFIELLQSDGAESALLDEMTGTIGTPTATDAAREAWKANDKPRPMTRRRDEE